MDANNEIAYCLKIAGGQHPVELDLGMLGVVTIVTEWHCLRFQGPWLVSYVERHLGTEALAKSELIDFLRGQADAAFLRRWRLLGANRNIKKTHNCGQLLAAYKVRVLGAGSGGFLTRFSVVWLMFVVTSSYLADLPCCACAACMAVWGKSSS